MCFPKESPHLLTSIALTSTRVQTLFDSNTNFYIKGNTVPQSKGTCINCPFAICLSIRFFIAKEVLKNLNEVSWNDSGTEVIRPNTVGSAI